ncbi:MAG TPA: M56 family metallopeptidase [Opitutaceae bacterium]|jgi:beta-lactamase regulating signal transducer with metallopeptidase domain
MNTAMYNVGWTIIHSIWEATAIWLALRVGLAAAPKASAGARYLVACAALAATAAAPILTFAWLELGAGAPFETVALWAVKSREISGLLPVSVAAVRPSGGIIDLVLPAIVYAWGLGCLWKSIRFARDWRTARYLSLAELSPLAPELSRRIGWLAQRLGIRRPVRAGECVLVDVPSVVRWLRPVILVPVGAFSGLNPEQIDGLIAHELAHIRRHDFAVNVVQSLCEILFFYHPAVLAVSKTIRRERESACDEVAVELTGDPLGYAAALAHLEGERHDNPVLAASGDGRLTARIRRIVEGRGRHRGPNHGSGWAALALCAAYAATFATIPGLVSHLSGQTAPPAKHDPRMSPYSVDNASPDLKAGLVAASNTWLTALDDGNYDQAYDAVGIWMHAQSVEWKGLPPRTEALWRTLGQCSRRSLSKEIQFTKDKFGEFADLQFDADYGAGGKKVEVVSFQKEPDGVWRICGFSIGDKKA